MFSRLHRGEASDTPLRTSSLNRRMAGNASPFSYTVVASHFLRRLERVNKELWLVFSLFALAGILNSLVASQRVVLGLYTLPTVVSAYLYGRRYATLTAFASTLLVVLLAWFNPSLLESQGKVPIPGGEWLDVVIWGGTLMVTGYLMGTLYDHKTEQMRELRDTYN